jgi:2-polyprenyl-6-hydroxyphenyl methylase/3-demethylubiquinone-9 3-methyltransferase
MWQAIANILPLVNSRGQLFIAIYNDQGGASRRWLRVKRLYNRLPRFLRWLVVVPSYIRLWGPSLIRELTRGTPGKTWREYKTVRGMDARRDMIDWIGGYPFEVATPDQIFTYFREQGFNLHRLKTCGGGHGCNEFVFAKSVTE